MRLSVFIAKRYLFSRKKQNAINIISMISVIGVTIGTAALIIILSVFNGIDLLLQKSTESFTPDLIVSPVQGKFIETDSALYASLRHQADVAFYNQVVEEKALVKYGDRFLPVTVKGVDENYDKHTHFENNIVEGEFLLKKEDAYRSVVGYGIAAALGISIHTPRPMIFYYPNRQSASSLSALTSAELYPSALFSSQQDIDGQYILTDIKFARQLFKVPDKISKIEIKLKDNARLKAVKKELKNIFPNTYKIEDKFELNKAFYAMMKSEKFAVFLILLFILTIASFNIIGSISMLILDKKEDLGIYTALGMTPEKMITIFKTEGNLITTLGALSGLLIGVLICWLQQKYGFVTLGDGAYMVTAYPVKLIYSDIFIIIATVLLIGYVASYFPVKFLINKLTKRYNH